MKNVLLATTALVMSTGFAAAEVTLSGDARMGFVSNDGDAQFSSRARVSFGLSGESDSGFQFGASFRADNAVDAAGGTAGSVYISGAFGKISMGDNDSAAQATVGQVDGVGYTGAGDRQEIGYLGDQSTSVLYTYASGGLSFAASLGQIDAACDANVSGDFETNDADDSDYGVCDADPATAYSVAVAYTAGDYTFSIGYENNATQAPVGSSDGYWGGTAVVLNDHIVLGADATFGALTVKARYGFADVAEDSTDEPGDFNQYALSATYTMDALSMTAFMAHSDLDGYWGDYTHTNRYGIGAAYDLGGGAAVKAGYSRINTEYSDDSDTHSDTFEAGLTFSF